MNESPLPNNDHLLDLLAQRATAGLSDAQAGELATLTDPSVPGTARFDPESFNPGSFSPELFDEAAGTLAIGLLMAEGIDEMPAGLRSRLDAIAEDFAMPRSDIPAPLPMTTALPEPTAPSAVGRGASARIGWLGGLGWLAAAACLAVALTAWRPRPAPTFEQQLALMETRPGIVRTGWLGLDNAGLSPDAHPADQNLTGEILWDPQSEQGFMVFEGLAPNDPSTRQYQLWIFDADRPTGQLPQYGEGILSQRPVDGGVFDIAAGGRVIVPIDPKLPIGRAAIFAVTVEPPGGVVVSDRDIVTLALVE